MLEECFSAIFLDNRTTEMVLEAELLNMTK